MRTGETLNLVDLREAARVLDALADGLYEQSEGSVGLAHAPAGDGSWIPPSRVRFLAASVRLADQRLGDFYQSQAMA